jgi:putative membrane protein
LAASGLPQTPLTSSDAQFVREQLENGMAEIKLAQLALQKSQDQNVRNYAQKMITDHTAADAQLMRIADAHNIKPSSRMGPMARAMERKLSTLDGVAFDTVYIDGMIHAHDADLKQLDAHQLTGRNPQINVWVQNTRPVVLQHDQIAQEIKANLPRTG